VDGDTLDTNGLSGFVLGIDRHTLEGVDRLGAVNHSAKLKNEMKQLLDLNNIETTERK
jgi:hypothetical protein